MSAVPLPWQPPVVGPLDGRLAAWADGARWPISGALGEVRWRRVATESAAAVAALVGEPSSVALPLTARDGGSAIAVVPWTAVAGLVRAALAGEGPRAADLPGADRTAPAREWPAPRPPTTVERAIVAAAIADALERAGVDGAVDLGRPAPPAGAQAVVRLSFSRPHAGELAVVVPVAPPPPPVRSLAELLPARGHRLPPVRAKVELARGSLPAAAAARLAAAAPGDVVLVGPRAAALRVGRGRVPGTLDAAAGELTVRAGYLRMDPMNPPSAPSLASASVLADDLAIPLAVVAGEVAVSARALLELAPGMVLPLGRPLGGVVDLWAGGRHVARGELVEVDGALGVRIAELIDDVPRAEPARPTPPRSE